VGSRLVTVDRYRRRATEAQMEGAIRDLVRLRGGRCWHLVDARDAPELVDLPDLLILVPGLAAWIELKSQRRIITPGQAEVAALLASATRFVGGIVRPDPRDGELSYDELLEVLHRRIVPRTLAAALGSETEGGMGEQTIERVAAALETACLKHPNNLYLSPDEARDLARVALAALAASDGAGTVRVRREDLETIIGWHDGWDLATTEENAAVRRMQDALAAAGEAGAGERGEG
jgi:hypothetical protein